MLLWSLPTIIMEGSAKLQFIENKDVIFLISKFMALGKYPLIFPPALDPGGLC